MSQGLHLVVQVAIALAVLALLVWPAGEANWVDWDGEEFDGVGGRDL